MKSFAVSQEHRGTVEGFSFARVPKIKNKSTNIYDSNHFVDVCHLTKIFHASLDKCFTFLVDKRSFVLNSSGKEKVPRLRFAMVVQKNKNFG